MADQSIPASTAIVLVTGSGRSGTSSLAGSLKRLGLHVPQPEVPAKSSNERGFYEPQWVIDFHKRHLAELALHNIDSRPQAVRMMADLLADGSVEQELRDWLSGQLAHPQIVIKDPHAFWFAAAWRGAADDLGADLRLLTALRHPAEVVGSRKLAYQQQETEALRRVKETSNIAGWVHAALLTEQAGRGRTRAFIRYPDLIADWRPALTRAGDQLDLTYEGDLSPGGHHEVDDFLDSTMRRSTLTWDDVTVPTALRDMADEVWQLVGGMVDRPDDGAASERLDEIHAAYDEMYEHAVATVYDHTHAEVVLAERANRAEIARLKQALRRQRRRVEELEAQEAARPSTVRRVLRRFRRGRPG
jgi:hypothetical protein